MVSLTMMARLLEAVRPEARLILVGDADQLASVEAGAVLADLVDGLDPTKLAASKTELLSSYTASAPFWASSQSRRAIPIPCSPVTVPPRSRAAR